MSPVLPDAPFDDCCGKVCVTRMHTNSYQLSILPERENANGDQLTVVIHPGRGAAAATNAMIRT